MPLRPPVYLTCFLLLSAFCGISQRYNFENFSVNNGLPNNVIRSIAQDELGFMYFGTNRGLSMYDGSSFTTLSLPGSGNDQQVFNMKYLASGKLWVTFTGNKDVFYVSRGAVKKPAATVNNDVNNIYELPKGVSYVCTDGGLFTCNGDVVTRTPLPIRNDGRVIHFICPVGDNRLLIGRKGYSLALVNRQDLSMVDETIEDISVNDIIPDPSGDYWIATDSHGLLILDGEALAEGKLRMKPHPASLAFLGKEDIFCLFRSPFDQAILLGTSHYGVVVYRTGGQVSFMNRTNGLSSNKIRCMFLDKDKTWWVGTDRGVDKLNNTQFMYYSMQGGEPIGGTFREARDRQGRVWYFGNEKFYYTRGDSAYSMEYPEGMEKIALASAVTASGIWVSVPHNLFFINTKSVEPYITERVSSTDIYRRMQIWDQDRIILGGRRSLAMLDRGKLVQLTTAFNDIRAMCRDDFGKLWLGTFSDGLYRVSLEDSADRYGVRQMQQILDSNGNYNRFLSLLKDHNGRVWAGTRFHGLYIYDVAAQTAAKRTEIGTANGLANNYVTSMAQTPSGDVWVGTGTGFDRVRWVANRFEITQISKYFHFNNPVNQLLADDQFVWVASDVGAGRLRLMPDRRYLFPTWFRDIRFPDSAWHLFSNDTMLQLRPDQNSFQISFTAPFYINEQQTRYFYRLINDDASPWTEVTGNHSINFNSLQSGNYVLELRSMAFNGQTSAAISRLGFVIATPFYRSAWFLTLMAAALLALAWLFYRYRIRELKKLYLVRDNISRNLHDEIGATLSSINIYSEVARQKVENQGEIRPLLDRIYSGSGQVMENMNDIVWYVNPKNDSWDDILVRMREFAIPILEAREVDVVFDAPDKLLHQKLSMSQRQNIYFIFKEAVNNIAKYSQARSVVIRLSRTASTLVLSIRDDGRGTDLETIRRGNGLSNMAQRAKEIRGVLDIRSAPGTGTSIELTIPVT